MYIVSMPPPTNHNEKTLKNTPDTTNNYVLCFFSHRRAATSQAARARAGAGPHLTHLSLLTQKLEKLQLLTPRRLPGEGLARGTDGLSDLGFLHQERLIAACCCCLLLLTSCSCLLLWSRRASVCCCFPAARCGRLLLLDQIAAGELEANLIDQIGSRLQGDLRCNHQLHNRLLAGEIPIPRIGWNCDYHVITVDGVGESRKTW